MSDDSEETRACPYCKEEIKRDAVKCRYCGSDIKPAQPSHGGRCPFCKEEIDPEATRCRYCQSYIGEADVPSVAPDDLGPPLLDIGVLAQVDDSIGPGGGYDPNCVRRCQWQCGFAGLPSWYCWYACAWFCSMGSSGGTVATRNLSARRSGESPCGCN